MARWVIIRHGEGREGIELVYQNLVQGRDYALGRQSSDWSDEDVVQWIFDNAENLTPGDFIRLSNGWIYQWDGRAFSENPWCRMRKDRASA